MMGQRGSQFHRRRAPYGELWETTDRPSHSIIDATDIDEEPLGVPRSEFGRTQLGKVLSVSANSNCGTSSRTS